MSTVIHAIIGYFYLLFILRLLIRRPGAQLSPSEFVLIFLMGGVIILSTMGEDRSITNSVVAVITIGICHRFVAYLKKRFPAAEEILDGTPLVLVKGGNWQVETMRGMHVSDADVMAAARRKGVKTLDGIKYAILERNGDISIIAKKQEN